MPHACNIHCFLHHIYMFSFCISSLSDSHAASLLQRERAGAGEAEARERNRGGRGEREGSGRSQRRRGEWWHRLWPEARHPTGRPALIGFCQQKKNLPPSISFRFTTAFPHVSAQLRLPAEAHSAFLAGCIARCVLSSLLQQNCWIPDRLAYFELNKHRCWNVDAAKNQAWDFCFLQERELQQRVVPLVYSCHFLFIPPSLSWFVI